MLYTEIDGIDSAAIGEQVCFKTLPYRGMHQTNYDPQRSDLQMHYTGERRALNLLQPAAWYPSQLGIL